MMGAKTYDCHACKGKEPCRLVVNDNEQPSRCPDGLKDADWKGAKGSFITKVQTVRCQDCSKSGCYLLPCNGKLLTECPIYERKCSWRPVCYPSSSTTSG